MVMIAHIPVVLFMEKYPVNVSFCLTFLYIFYYVLLDPVAGSAMAPFLILLSYSANVFALQSEYSWILPIGIQIAAWTSQIFGHAVFEKRSPAFLDNLVQSFLAAPFFVFMEVLFMFGYRPSLQKRVSDRVKGAISTWKRSRDKRH